MLADRSKLTGALASQIRRESRTRTEEGCRPAKRDQTGADWFNPMHLACRRATLHDIGGQDSLERRLGDHALGLRLKSVQMIAKRRRRAPNVVTKGLPLRKVFLPSHLFLPSCVTDLNLRVNPGFPTFGIETSGTLFNSQPVPECILNGQPVRRESTSVLPSHRSTSGSPCGNSLGARAIPVLTAGHRCPVCEPSFLPFILEKCRGERDGHRCLGSPLPMAAGGVSHRCGR